jgi:hypothetical protein
MDKLARIQALRDEYEAALDEAERLRDEYHREIVKLHRSGMSLRDIAERLGISHQRVHQIVAPHEAEPRRRADRRGLAGAGGLLVLLIAGGLWLTRSDPAQPPTAGPQPSRSRELPSIVRPSGGAVAVIDPDSGEVLALITGRQHRALEEYLAEMAGLKANA